jgi:hypothetical protein
MRKLRTVLAALVLCVFAGHAFADTSADKGPGDKKAPKKEAPAKAKTGQACKVDADCDQSGNGQRCNSDKTCSPVIVHPVT